MKTINIHQAKTHLSEIIQDVLNGDGRFGKKFKKNYCEIQGAGEYCCDRGNHD